MSALDRLFRFARRAEFDGAHRVASAAVWEDWSKRAGEKGNRKSLGTVAAEGKRLVFEATSRRRAENGRTLIEAVGRGDAKDASWQGPSTRHTLANAV